MEKTIEIPFGAKDSELKGWEYTIPENMEAEIKDGKIIVKQKESEDERIRKEIMHYILYCADGISEEQEIKWIAYLEKHIRKDEEVKEIEDKSIESLNEAVKNGVLVGPTIEEAGEKESEGERIRKEIIGFIDRVLKDKKVLSLVADRIGDDVPNMATHWVAYLERQKEQKPIISAEESLGISQEEYNKIVDECIFDKHKEHKPSEDKDAIEPTPKQDYSGLTDFERAIHRGFLCAGVENVLVGIIKDTAQDCLAQIKPAEWSEEDEKCCKIALLALNDHPLKQDELKAFNWLRALKSRFGWKPSEE